MRVLVLGRLFNGLKDGVADGEWRPKGVPAFYKLVERLRAMEGIELLTVLACKDADARFARSSAFVSGEAGRILVLGASRPSGGRLRRLDVLVTEIRHMAGVLWIALRYRPDIVYATYALVLPAAVLARFFGQRVVLRLMGLFPHHRAMREGRFPLLRWALRSPFDAVVCTEDGSDPSLALPPLLHEGSELIVRLNGCDAATRPGASPPAVSAPPRVLFVGRLEDYKGCAAFVDAAVACLGRDPDAARFEIVGEGTMREALQRQVADAGLTRSIRFEGALPHAAVMERLRAADIYVSVNMNGNLSNANLEALAAGLCLVVPTSDPAIPVDTSTDRLIPDRVAMRYDRSSPSASLVGAIRGLLADRAAIATRKAAAMAHAAAMLRPWPAVVDDDIAVLERHCRRQGLRAGVAAARSGSGP